MGGRQGSKTQGYWDNTAKPSGQVAQSGGRQSMRSMKTPPGASSAKGYWDSGSGASAQATPLAPKEMGDMSKYRGTMGGGGSMQPMGGGGPLAAALQKMRSMQGAGSAPQYGGSAERRAGMSMPPVGMDGAGGMGTAGMRHGGAVRQGRLVGSRRGFQVGGIADAMGGMAPGMVPPGMEGIGGMAPGMMQPGMEEGVAIEEQVTDIPGVGEFGAMEEQATEVPMPETSGEVAQQQEMLNIVLEAKAALEGNHPNPEEAIMKFLEVFGEEELESLKVAVIEEMQSGEVSDGMSDTLPANIDGQEEIAVSEGEYIVPSDAVSGLGNGDTNSGAQRLGEMVNKIRTVRGGSPVQPREMMAEEVMPI